MPKLHSECPLGIFSIKILFLRKNLFHLNYANRAGRFSPFVEVSYDGLSKSPSTCPMEHLEGIIFFQFPFFLFQFRTLIENLHAILENIPTKLSKLIPDACPRVNTGERIFNRNIVFFILFGQWAEKFRPFDKIFKAEFWKLHSTCPQKQFENFFAKKNYFHHFWNLKEKKLRLFPEKYRRGCQNCILPVHRNIWRSFFRKNYHFITLGRCWRVVQPLPEKFRRFCEFL